MPVIKSAIKKLRQDKKRRIRNLKAKDLLKSSIKKAKKNPSLKTIQETVSLIDKAAKQHILHKNKSARIKSQLSKLMKPETKKASSGKTAIKKPIKKSSAKKNKA